jgi:IS30 family transposase
MNYFRNLWSAICGRSQTPERKKWLRLTPLETGRIKFLHAEGYSQAAIARELGFRTEIVRQALKRARNPKE